MKKTPGGGQSADCVTRALLAAVLLVLISAKGGAGAATLFTENFESYAAGSNLVGQGGWFTVAAPGVGPGIKIGDASYLSTRVLKGEDASGLSEVGEVFHVIAPLDPARITTISFDSFAPPGSHNYGLSLETDPLSSVFNVRVSRPDGGWQLQIPSVVVLVTPGGLNETVHMSLVVDGIANEMYGRYDFGSGFFDTPHFAVSDALISEIDTLNLIVDYRGTFGGEIDNLRVSDDRPDGAPAPEPATIFLLASGLAILAWHRRGGGRGGQARAC